MLYNSKRKKLCTSLLTGWLLCIAGLVSYSCSDKYDLDSDDNQPSNLSTLYGYLQNKGNFTNFLQLIDDLDYTEVLNATGSMTLFAADDDAFDKFYASNDWGVKRYADLSEAQKKLLFNSARIGNPYPTSMLSTAEDAVKGEVCRRASSQSIYDSVQVVSTKTGELPDNPKWNVLKGTHDEIVLFRDASGAPPMVHFTPKFVSANRLESSDIDFLYNDPAGTRDSSATYVNRAKIVESQFCKNGFVHIVDRVVTPLDNMADIITQNPRMSLFTSIMERFSAPDFAGATYTSSYNQNKNTDVDSVYVKRYFSKRSNGSSDASSVAFDTDKDGLTLEGSLKYDPEWNQYLPEITNPRDGMMEDMAVMLVPSDQALTDWWNNGGGKVIKDEYGTLDNTPISVLQELVNVNQLTSLVASVPSRFSTVLNDANETMGLTTDAVDSVYLGCNGAVYLTNKVFAPTSYSSVLFPAVIDTENLSIIKNAIDNLDYDAYLNSMVSTYSFFIPTNDGFLAYIDPVSYGQQYTKLWEFHYDGSKAEANRISADVYQVDTLTWQKVGTSIETRTGINDTQIKNRLTDLLDNIIGVEAASSDHHYILTKGKNYVKVGGNLNQEGAMTAAGGFQVELGQPLTIKQIYTMDNGYAYVLDGALMGTRRAASDVLAETSQFSEFYEILSNSGCLATTNTDGYCSTSQDKGSSSRGNLVSLSTNDSGKETIYSLLNTFHYTLYAPTNDAMKIAYAAGLPTVEQLIAAEEYDSIMNAREGVTEVSDSAEHIRYIMRDFVKYHVQSNSIYVDGGFSTGEYESSRAKLDYQLDDDGNRVMTGDSTAYKCISGSPYRITVTNVNESGLTLRDAMGNTVNVVTTEGLYNIPAREYWLNGTSINSATTIQNSSSLVVHAVDRPLLFDAEQFKYVPRSVVSGEDAKRRK